MAYCINCGSEIKEDYEYCPECGQPIQQNSIDTYFDSYSGKFKICKQCGERMPEDSFYCLNCGMTFDDHNVDFEDIKKRVQVAGVADTSLNVWKSKWVALFLCLFFGIFGVHRYYEGKIVTGLIYNCTLGLFGIGWLFDIIRIAIKPNPYQVKKHRREQK